MTCQKPASRTRHASFSREGNAIFVHFKGPFSVGQSGIIEIFYEGNPREARLAPWDGGFSWKKDESLPR